MLLRRYTFWRFIRKRYIISVRIGSRCSRNAIEKPAKTITIIDFYRYSTTILDYVKSSNADSLALSTL
jgi:hypothetical protein